MPRYKIAPTKTNLFKIKHERDFAEEGHALLEQKREILVAELMKSVDAAAKAQADCDEAFKSAHAALAQALTVMGRNAVQDAAQAVNFRAQLDLRNHKIIGIDVPLIDVVFEDNPPYYGLQGTSVALDESVQRFKDIVRLMGKFAQMRITTVRIADEVTRTMRRVNALEKIYLPDCSDTIKYISDALQEQEREAFFTLKMVKSRLEDKE